ncbi:MAG: hypothetical protein O3C19_06785 [Bacteroidetes bacterium]|nr:hypothetical protein [Bacteroidota bacterium]
MARESWGVNRMNPEFIDWCSDLKPSQWIMWAQAYGTEARECQIDQSFQDWLYYHFKKQKENNE